MNESEIVIQIDQPSPAVDALLASSGLASWCFITAANPVSKLLADAENAARNQALRERLEAEGLAFHYGEGRGQAGGEASGWPPEPSFLVLGPSRARSVAFARAFDQTAVVFGEIGRPAELVDCRAGMGGRG